MKTNVQRSPVHTHEGARASHVGALESLRRSVLSCLLWEDEFYEDGKSIAERIHETAAQCKAEDVARLAAEARGKYRLRHAPLWLAVGLTQRRGKIVGDTIAEVIQRADELAEFLSLYWRGGKHPLSKQVKRGLALAFQKFSPYQLAKYDRAGAIRLRDVMFLVHPKPKNQEQAETWKQLVDGTLPPAETWEKKLSAGEDKGETFETMLREGTLGYMALLRNLRNMKEANVPKMLVAAKLLEGAVKSKALPFRYVAAARAVPGWEDIIDPAMQAALEGQEKIPGRTIVLIDVSGSMFGARLSAKSDLDRIDAGSALAVLLSGVCEDAAVYTFSQQLVEVANRRGLGLIDAIKQSQDHGGTYLGGAIERLNQVERYDRIVVFTDEQSHDRVGAPKAKGYMVNVASNKYGVGYGAWTHISGFSEAVVDFIRETERGAVG